jgi:hypothetical protein
MADFGCTLFLKSYLGSAGILDDAISSDSFEDSVSFRKFRLSLFCFMRNGLSLSLPLSSASDKETIESNLDLFELSPKLGRSSSKLSCLFFRGIFYPISTNVCMASNS